MRNSDIMLAAVTDGDGDDSTISAALDALRDDAQCDWLNAVLAVARAWRIGAEARELSAATAAIAKGATHRTAILSRIAEHAAPDFPTDLFVVVVEGDSPPVLSHRGVADLEDPDPSGDGWFGPMSASVGAKWVLNVLHELGQHKRRRRRAR